MKRVLMLMAALVLCGAAKAGTAQAAEAEYPENMITVRCVETEDAVVPEEITGEQQVLVSEEIYLPEAETAASYTPQTHTRTFEFYNGSTLMGSVTERCTVWYYTDGKVHLYSRYITTTQSTNYSVSKKYGSIVNTDGSYSYTSGDLVYVTAGGYTVIYALDFYVDSDGYDFSLTES